MMQDKDHFIISEDLKNSIDMSSYFDDIESKNFIVINHSKHDCRLKSIKCNVEKNHLSFSFFIRLSGEMLNEALNMTSFDIQLDEKKFSFRKDEILSISFDDGLLKLKFKFDFS